MKEPNVTDGRHRSLRAGLFAKVLFHPYEIAKYLHSLQRTWFDRPMQIALPSPSSRLSWKILCLFLMLAYIGAAIRDYVAYRLSASQQPHEMEQAIALDPSDAGYHDRLGEYFMFSDQRPDLAVLQYRSAVALNPHIAEYWLDLANAYASTGAGEQQARALEQAHQVDPTTPEVSWQVANAFLTRGDLQKAFGMFRIVLQTDPLRVRPALQVCWYTTQDLKMMMDILPPLPNVYLEFLKLLINERQTSAAEEIWSQLVAVRQPFDPQEATHYFEYLISEHHIDRAQAAWNDLGRLDPGFRPHLRSAENLVVNSGFEEKLLNMGFDWRYKDSSHVTLALDREQFHQGSRSVSIVFDGQADAEIGLSQFVAVDPNTRYDFSVYVKTDNIFAAQGPEFVISDAYTQEPPLLLTEDLLGTCDWRQVSGSFKTSPSTDLVVLKIIRPAGASPITGRLWVDDVVVVRE
jgi:tetratricopeptide (TPR) repeat protein